MGLGNPVLIGRPTIPGERSISEHSSDTTGYTKAIKELGRATKTRFLFTYLEDETLHALRQFIFFANVGPIWHRRPEDQTNQALCLNLVADLVVVWNTFHNEQ